MQYIYAYKRTYTYKTYICTTNQASNPHIPPLDEVSPLIFAHKLPKNWCGRTKMRMSAPLVACARKRVGFIQGFEHSPCNPQMERATTHRQHAATHQQPKTCKEMRTDTTSGSATTLRGSLMPGMYLTFSWSSLMMSVSLRPPTISSNTHMRTCGENVSA